MLGKIALGFGNNVDFEVHLDPRVFQDMIDLYDIHPGELNQPREIRTERDLILSILGFLHSGSGGERFVLSSEIIECFSQKFHKKVTLGGTSVRAAFAMWALGHRPVLHLVTINDYVRKLMPSDLLYVCSNSQDTLYPHLIVQFDEGVTVYVDNIQIRSSRANRIIYHNDIDNIQMHLNEEFAHLITNAKILLISGFNAMQDPDLLTERLQTLRKILRYLPPDAVVYYEDASFYEPSFRKLIHAALAEDIDIYGLNEDELQSHLGKEIDPLDVVQVQKALEELHEHLKVPLIVVHSMYWALAYGENAGDVEKALQDGVTMATTRFCYGDNFTLENYRQVKKLPSNPKGVALIDKIKSLLGNKISCAPVPHVDQTNATTVGLGDAFVGGFLAALSR
ncbi:ADP-dependent glucokinase/phosphofructokinase [Caldilinea sp.]|jgi:ADP-dependent phosphofructokinase/glucokinase|uniref:ADP-dependent glucokinase/phosphofructokinase n=1 Tax=Caldilinea sp. TaxID=2293560 RepID=UPI0021DDACB3|nr:ADP-dependent glucokinase/phosphofructokinase [Caldilinea sp.]GIV70302.1 MAG: hypothetical protein KatS3mg048_3164 [Caldilinea sp.]